MRENAFNLRYDSERGKAGNSTKLQTKLRAELRVWVRVRFKFKQQKKGKKN